MNSNEIVLMAVGDVSPSRDDPPSIFRFCREVLRSADVLFGQMEAPLSDRGERAFTPQGQCRLPAKNITALTAEDGAGFDVMSFAGNHSMDFGEVAFFDTIQALTNAGIAVVGAGSTIKEARNPVIVERNGTKIGFLAYTSILYPGLEAEEEWPGCAVLRAETFYKQVDYQPGTPPKIISSLLPEYRKILREDVEALRSKVDVLVVSHHAGVHFQPAMVAMYQKEAAYLAIDCGADLILQGHAHILKGIEMYKGKAIFYGLGNFAAEHGSPPGAKWRRAGDPGFRLIRKHYRIKTVAGYERNHSHFDALKTMIVKIRIRDKKIARVAYLPVYITPNLEPEVLNGMDRRRQEVFDYVRDISETEDLRASFSWEGDEVLVSALSRGAASDENG
jgi:poly-gamma-glutamate capsule biosynthesis protein CapA/YwtB (metallophosphatase superfamily)